MAPKRVAFYDVEAKKPPQQRRRRLRPRQPLRYPVPAAKARDETTTTTKRRLKTRKRNKSIKLLNRPNIRFNRGIPKPFYPRLIRPFLRQLPRWAIIIITLTTTTRHRREGRHHHHRRNCKRLTVSSIPPLPGIMEVTIPVTMINLRPEVCPPHRPGTVHPTILMPCTRTTRRIVSKRKVCVVPVVQVPIRKC